MVRFELIIYKYKYYNFLIDKSNNNLLMKNFTEEINNLQNNLIFNYLKFSN